MIFITIKSAFADTNFSISYQGWVGNKSNDDLTSPFNHTVWINGTSVIFNQTTTESTLLIGRSGWIKNLNNMYIIYGRFYTLCQEINFGDQYCFDWQSNVGLITGDTILDNSIQYDDINWTSINNTWSFLIGFTNNSYTGNLTNGTDIGYVAANSICNQEFSGSHFCLEVEVLQTIASGNYNYTGTYWMQKGAPGYTANADDCMGWTTASNTYLGPFWNWDGNVQAGYGRLTNCAQSKQLMCCD